MQNEWLFPEEELLRAGSEVPTLSSGFRSRVLATAQQSRQRRDRCRRALWAAGLLFAGMGITAWHGPLATAGFGITSPALASEAYENTAPLINVSQRYGRGERLVAAAGDDWQLVEAEIESRHEGSRQIRTSF